MHLKIDDVEFEYSSVPVLKDICLEVDGAQFVSILGPNGVGKSTLIHCINKILVPSKGVVTIDGSDVKEISLKELAKQVGYVPYTSSDTFPLTVVDTVLMGRHPHSKWKSLDRDLDIVYDTLKLMGIEDLAMRPFNELSAGQRQKVMLSRGLVQEPNILLLDEPTANLDVRHQLEVTKILLDLAREKSITIVMISHDLNIAAKYADNMILMYDGSIFAVGKPHEVLTEDNLRIVYGVDSMVINDEGRPHVILRDSIEGYEEMSRKAKETGEVAPLTDVPVLRTGFSDKIGMKTEHGAV
jgi:iron complex transport system ATP-binding protein